MAADHAVKVLCPVAGREANGDFGGEAFDLIAIQTAEMKMVVRMFFVAAAFAKGKVLFTVVGNDAVGDAVGTEPVENTVYRSPVNGTVELGQDLIVA